MKCPLRLLPLFLSVGCAGVTFAQANVCAPSANPPIVRAEGLAERIGDLLYICTGKPNGTLTGNLTVGLNTNVTNRISSGNTLTGIVFTFDNGSGPQPVLVPPMLFNPSTVVYNGVSLTFSPQGTLTLVIAGIRANAAEINPGQQIFASVSLNGAELLTPTTSFTVGTPERGLYIGFSTSLICEQSGSPLPATISFTSLIQTNTAFASTRVTEGFADAFGPRSAWAYFNADSGQRIIIQYSNFPQGARLFVPDVVAGSDAIQPTAGGDYGLSASGGAYAPSATGSLLLARVSGADVNGAGGTPVYFPGAIGSGTATFDTVSELTIAGGSAYAVYEVVDANASIQETAQFPTFLGLAPNGTGNPVQTSEAVFFAPVSTVGNASAVAPIPRFAAVQPLSDCSIIGDCDTDAAQLAWDAIPLQYTAFAGSAIQEKSFTVLNYGAGVMQWTASVNYAKGNGWLTLNPSSGINDALVTVDAVPGNLAPDTYQATITLAAAAGAGSTTIPVTLVITPAAGAPPSITSIVNAASLAAAPAVPGSLSAITGSGFLGANVTATFNGLPATIISSSASQIVLVVPSQLVSSASAQLVVTVDGSSSAPQSVPIAPFAPAIFPGDVFNQDSTANGANNGADPGSVIYLYATGLSRVGTITGHIYDRDIPVPYYAGPAPGYAGVQQINLLIPSELPAMTTDLYVCGAGASDPGSKVCSVPAQITIK